MRLYNAHVNLQSFLQSILYINILACCLCLIFININAFTYHLLKALQNGIRLEIIIIFFFVKATWTNIYILLFFEILPFGQFNYPFLNLDALLMELIRLSVNFILNIFLAPMTNAIRIVRVLATA